MCMSKQHSLDGLWQFLPLRDGATAELAVPPRDGYESLPIRVPGYWNTFPASVGGDWGAYDHYGYPSHWQDTAAAWYRRSFQTPPTVGKGGIARLCFAAVAGRTTVWLNGRRLGDNVDSFLPFAFDVTNLIERERENELAVLVEPPPKTPEGLWRQPCGSWVGWHLRGIWGPVVLETTPASAIRDVFAQSSVRNDELAVEVELELAEGFAGELRVSVLQGKAPILDLGRRRISGADGRKQTVRLSVERPGLESWSPEHPQLYHVRAELCADGRVAHVGQVRFGFREFCIEGTHFVLNGRPIRLFGDSWHYMGSAQQNPAYARTWFGFAKSTGVNVIRTHAMPYPPLYFDLADELGMMIIDESAVYGSAGTLAYDDPRFWDNCRDHMRRLVRRDRNHPSIIFWSACNETVWKGGEKAFPHLLSLGEAARRLDPTRLVSYDENDCDLGGGSPVHAGHYGTPAHWDRSWKRDKPLTVHEFGSLYHGGPESVSHVGNDAVYADYLTRLRAAGEEAADMFLQLRRLGAASITPWNLNWYCLEPIPAAAVEDVPAGLTAGGAPIRRIGPRALTLNYGYLSDQPAWRPNPAYEPLAACYRRRRFYLPRRPRQGFAGSRINVRAALWNDTAEAAEVELTLCLKRGDGLVGRAGESLRLEANAAQDAALGIELPQVAAAEACVAELTLSDGPTGQTLHVESWPLHVHPPLASPSTLPWAAVRQRPTAWIVGQPARPTELLEALGLRASAGDEPPKELLRDPRASLLLAGPHGGRTLNDWLSLDVVDRWIRTGGRLVISPAAVTDDPSSPLAPIHQTRDHAYLRDTAGGLLRGLTDSHFRDWPGAGTVARVVFQRPATGSCLAPLDVGDPSEGLSYTPLVIVPHGRGQVVVSGMELLDRAADTPAAAILLYRLLHDELALAPASNAVAIVGGGALGGLLDEVGAVTAGGGEVIICDGGSQDTLNDLRLQKENIDGLLDAGGSLLINALTPETTRQWSRRLGVPLTLREDVCFNVARACDHELLAGLNNFDLCWVHRDEKQPITRHTLEVDSAVGQTLVQTVATRWEDYQTAAEQHKVGMMYRRLESFTGPRAAVLELRRGRGRVIISQLLLAEAHGLFHVRAQRILSRWLDALGVCRRADVSPLIPRQRRPVDAEGYITAWLVLGPFGDARGHPLDEPFVSEQSLRPAEGESVGGRVWRCVSSAFAQIDLSECFESPPPTDRVAYVAVYVHSPQDRSVLLDAPDMIALRAGADGGVKVFLNGAVVGRFDFVRELVLDSDQVNGLPLRRGWNTLVLKLHNPAGPWRFAARLRTAAGDPPGDLRCAVSATE